MGKHPAPTRSPDPARFADRVKLLGGGADVIHNDPMTPYLVLPGSA